MWRKGGIVVCSSNLCCGRVLCPCFVSIFYSDSNRALLVIPG